MTPKQHMFVAMLPGTTYLATAVNLRVEQSSVATGAGKASLTFKSYKVKGSCSIPLAIH